MRTTFLTNEQKEFFAELSQKFEDTIESVEMVCFDGDKHLFESIGLQLPPGRNNLWAILAYGKEGLHIYVNPTEATILGFKLGNQKTAPKEQLFSFSNFASWDVETVVKRFLCFQSVNKYALSLNITYNSPVQGDVRGTLLIQTQMPAKNILSKMKEYKNK